MTLITRRLVILVVVAAFLTFPAGATPEPTLTILHTGDLYGRLQQRAGERFGDVLSLSEGNHPER